MPFSYASTALLPAQENLRLAVIGQGYVGLPLALAFAQHFPTVGYDIDPVRIRALQDGHDSTQEVSTEELTAASLLRFSTDTGDLVDATVYIVTVPTPIDAQKCADFSPLIHASQTLGRILKRGDVVIYESTVYPGATEEICIPVLEAHSSLRVNHDFHVGYSPERINPGDRQRRLSTIPKVTAGSTPATADFVDALYRRIITAGTHKASSIQVAEAAKVIENTQRDANIALINEFALIFHRLGIDTQEVLAAAATKWNFLAFQPGLVGGHCIGVDPYYLIQKAQSVGYHPDILLACRRINDAMGTHVAAAVVKQMILKGHAVRGSRLLMLGLTFKENCPDLRNTRVVELVQELRTFGIQVDIHDPWADPQRAQDEYGIALLPQLPATPHYDAIVLAVAHEQFRDAAVLAQCATANAVIYDIKGVLPATMVDARL